MAFFYSEVNSHVRQNVQSDVRRALYVPVTWRNKDSRNVLNTVRVNPRGYTCAHLCARASNPQKNQLFFRPASSVHRDVLYTILHFSFIPHSAATPFLTRTCVINSSLKHSIKIPHGLAQKKKRYSRTGTFSSSYFSSVRRFTTPRYI